MKPLRARKIRLSGLLLAVLLAGCGQSNTASTDPGGSQQQAAQQAPQQIIVQAATVTGAEGIAIDNYALVSSTRISRTMYEYTYKADVSNWGSGDANITATLASNAAQITVVQGTLNFGEVIEGATRESTDTFTIRHDRSQPFDENALVWTVQATPLAPTTYALIDNAVTSGAIDAETGLVYKVFYELNDPRLPAEFVGRDDGFFEAGAAQQAELSFDTLTPATQQILAPLLQGPDLSGTAPLPAASGVGIVPAAAAVSWEILEVVPGTLYIWWDAASPLAAVNQDFAYQAQAEILDNIWPKLSGLFGIPAAGKTISIILDEDIARSRARASADCSSVDILLSLTQGQNIVIAHEMTHALLDLNYPSACHSREAHWLNEATAQWAQHFVYAPANYGGEQVAAPWMLNRPELPLDTDEGAAANAHQYGAYLWFLYLTAGDSSGTVNANTLKVRQTWAAYGSLNPLQAINSVVPGGLTQKWHEFALYNWNREVTGLPTITFLPTTCSLSGSPYAYYGQWDCLGDKARENTGEAPVSVTLGGSVTKTYPMPHEVKYLSAAYFDYDFSKDNKIRRIRLTNPYYSSTAGNVKVQAIVKLRNKGWQTARDWTTFERKTLCRDKPAEDFERVVIVLSNSEFSNKSFVMKDNGANTMLEVSALGCSNWKGTVQFSATAGGSGATTLNESGVATNVTLKILEDRFLAQTFSLTGGVVNWQHSGSYSRGGDTCAGTSSGGYSLAGSFDGLEWSGWFAGAGADLAPRYLMNGFKLVGVSPPDDYVCSSDPQTDAPIYGTHDKWLDMHEIVLSGNSPGLYDWDPDGNVLQGTSIIVEPGTTDPAGNLYTKTRIYTWKFEKNGTFDGEPLP